MFLKKKKTIIININPSDIPLGFGVNHRRSGSKSQGWILYYKVIKSFSTDTNGGIGVVPFIQRLISNVILIEIHEIVKKKKITLPCT